MRRLLFFCRVAFICNSCFLLAWLSQYVPVSLQGHAGATIVVLGTGVAIVLNILVNFFVIISLLQKKGNWSTFPRWLIISNFLLMLFQLIVLFFI